MNGDCDVCDNGLDPPRPYHGLDCPKRNLKRKPRVTKTKKVVAPVIDDWRVSQLRDYQLNAAEWLAELPHGTRGKLLADGLGVGKSRSALAAMRLRYERGLMTNPCGIVFTTANSAHDWRREAAKFWPELKTHLIGSESSYQRKNESDEDFAQRRNGEWQAMLTGDEPALIISSYEGGERIDEFATAAEVLFDNIIIDECFTGETMVWTEHGEMRIDSIAPGDYVWAFNGQQLVLREVTACQTRLATTLEVVFPTHRVKSTPNHPYLTMKGWKRAEDLEAGDEVVCVVSGEAGEGEGPSLLREELQRLVEDGKAGSEGAVHPGTGVAHQQGASRAGENAQGQGDGAGLSQADAAAQSDAAGEGPHEGVAGAQGVGASPGAGREREAVAGAASPAGGGAGLAHGGGGAHGEEARPAFRAEAGHRARADEGGRRSGWPLASIAEGTGGGPAEGRLPPGFGVVRVQGVERGRAGEYAFTRLVHNLEVAEAHTYVLSGGLIVHNCHRIKGEKTTRAKLMRTFVARSTASAFLTGTPVENRPEDLFNIMDLCKRGVFGTYWRFAERFFQLHVGSRGFGHEVGDVLDKQMLKDAIAPFVMGRSAAEVMGKMPVRQRLLKLIDAPGAERISPAKLHLFKESTGIEAACRGAVKYKLAAAVELVQDIDQPVVLYTYRREDANQLSKLLSKAKVPNLVATGDSTTKARDAIIERWKNGEATALICTMDAVRESATLVRASVMVFVDLTWLPGTILQCEGRIDPARQPVNERRPVTYYYLVTRGGPDEVVAESLVHKIEQASGIGVKNQLADSFGEFLAPLDKRVKAEEISGVEMMADLTARLTARANRFADLGMLD